MKESKNNLINAINYRELEKYRTYPRGWTYVRGHSKERSVRLRGSDEIIGSINKEIDDDGRVWWSVGEVKFQLLILAGDYIYTQYKTTLSTTNQEENNATSLRK